MNTSAHVPTLGYRVGEEAKHSESGTGNEVWVGLGKLTLEDKPVKVGSEKRKNNISETPWMRPAFERNHKW